MSRSDKGYTGFSDAEKKAMQERARELELQADKGKLKGKTRFWKVILVCEYWRT